MSVNLAHLVDFDKHDRGLELRRQLARRFELRQCALPQELAEARASDLALLLGVTADTIRNWKAGRCLPQPRHRPKLRALRHVLRQLKTA